MPEKLKIDDKDLIEETLSFSSISNSVFQQLNDSNLIFISENTKKAVELYRNTNGEDRNKAKNLWKELLIDAICILKINDKRESLYRSAEKILTKNVNENTNQIFSKNLTDIRKISTYGIDELSKYFDDFVEYESVLYGTGEYYRDHIHHVLSVWAIGISLMMGNRSIGIEFSDGFKFEKMDFHFQIPNNKSTVSISKSELWSMWSIIALCHDLGYPLEKTSHINKKVKKIVNHFGCLNFNELNFNFDLFNGYIIEKFLNIVASKTIRIISKENRGKKWLFKKNKINKIKHKTEVQQKYHYKISKSLEDYQHGMFSGLLIFKKLTYFLETDYSPDNNSLSDEDLRQFYIRKEILRAICGHTCNKIYHLNMSTPSFLLIICDELQTWGRPRFDDLLSGDKKDDKEVIIKSYEKGENDTKIHIQFTYTNKKIDIGNTDKEMLEIDLKNNVLVRHLVLDSYEKIHYLLRSAKDDNIRKIYFRWDINFKNFNFVYIFDSNKDSFEMMTSSYNEIDGNKRKGNLKLYENLNLD